MDGGRPAEWVANAVARFGEAGVARRCAALLRGGDDAELLPYLGGPAVGLADTGVDYWPRVWGARGLRYAWADEAAPAVVAGLSDPAWRVREMCLKVVHQYELGEAADTVALRARDEVPRVRAAAARALAVVGEAEHAAVLHERADEDEDATVRRRAGESLTALSRRLDRDL